MTPVFETPEDRANEERAARRYCDSRGLLLQMRPQFSPFDFFGYEPGNPNIVVAGEVKCRNVRSGGYGGYAYFDREKAEVLRAVGLELGCDAVAVLEYTDGLFCVDADTILKCRTTKAKRHDRGDHDRLQDACLIPLAKLQRIRTKQVERRTRIIPELESGN